MKVNKYKIVREFHAGEICYVGYRRTFWGKYIYISGCISESRNRCEQLVSDYNFCKNNPLSYDFIITTKERK